MRHRPFTRANHRIALLATLQLLGERGLDLDLSPARAARDLVRAIETGAIDRAGVAAWLRSREGAGLAAQILHEHPGADRATIVQTIQGLAPLPHPDRDALMAGLDRVFTENERLHTEVERLRALLRHHGMEPDTTPRTA
ncbi:hypothetical protein [Spirillospora sp. NPDC047279]|uniref:hypothetical protein n=1 Tax=Spirillospora sp. NPDC047279 TaxID=3155478 RepID=UPI003404E249